MENATSIPTAKEKVTALESYDALTEVLKNLKSDFACVTIKETKQDVELPAFAIKLLQEIMKQIAKGNPISIVPIATEVTTQKAADILSVSRPFIVKLLENGEIPFTKVGRHRRLKFNDVIEYKKMMMDKRRNALEEMIAIDQKYGLYD